MPNQATREAAADVIDGAIDVLHENGWCQNTMQDKAGRMCIEGALLSSATAMYMDGLRTAACRGALHAARMAVAAEVGFQPSSFNDLSTTTFEDVALTLKRTGHSLREVA